MPINLFLIYSLKKLIYTTVSSRLFEKHAHLLAQKIYLARYKLWDKIQRWYNILRSLNANYTLALTAKIDLFSKRKLKDCRQFRIRSHYRLPLIILHLLKIAQNLFYLSWMTLEKTVRLHGMVEKKTIKNLNCLWSSPGCQQKESFLSSVWKNSYII